MNQNSCFALQHRGSTWSSTLFGRALIAGCAALFGTVALLAQEAGPGGGSSQKDRHTSQRDGQVERISNRLPQGALPSAAPGHAESSLWAEGRWVGGAIQNGAVTTLVYDFWKSEKGIWEGRLEVPQNFEKGIVVTGLDIQGSALQLDAPGRAKAQASFHSRSGDLVGTVEGEGFRHPLFLRRIGPPRPEGATSKPFPVKSGQLRLAAELILPPGDGPFPALIYFHGRSVGARGQFTAFAKRLAEEGIAALIFDRRGEGQSQGDKETAGIWDYIEDGVAIVKAALEREELDPKRLGLISWSAGGWVTPAVANRQKGIDHLILRVAPAERLSLQQKHVTRYRPRQAPFTEDQLSRVAGHTEDVMRYALGELTWEELLARQASFDGTALAPIILRVEDPNDPDFDWLRRFEHDHESELSRLKIPVLALYGERDFVVPPQVNVPKLKAALERAGNQSYRIGTLPGVGHNLTLPALSAPQEGEAAVEGMSATFPSRLAPGYVDALLQWLDARGFLNLR
ncbi:MAG: alpha/beta fold hydrolase [Deltaproteobacteria bacterium]|nr:alpha/beta fold hydrolase [Deltaproteobacteria bacterium]